jgi:hypothetical protein
MSKKKMALIILVVILLAVVGYFFIGISKSSEDVEWGVNFSQKRSEEFGLDWKQNYLAILDDLGASRIKIASHWDLIEKKEGEYFFENLDFQIEEARKRDAKVILVVGRKTPGWPECHVPEWAASQTKEKQQEKILALISEIVNRYKDLGVIEYWQVENEPFFPFGECLWKDPEFLKKEIDLVKSIDNSKPIIVSDSGEFSLWFKAASHGDVLGVTMYKKAWFGELGLYINYPFPAVFYNRKANLIRAFLKKDVFCVELQAEPWGPVLNYRLPLEEQEKTMTIEKLRKNINFAKKTNLNKFYLWGAEWWYWMKVKNNRPEFWNEMKSLFK